MLRGLLAALTTIIAVSGLSAEAVDVKYRGKIDLAPFACTDTPRSSFIGRVCYDQTSQYMVIKLQDTYYHYCRTASCNIQQLHVCSIDGAVL